MSERPAEGQPAGDDAPSSEVRADPQMPERDEIAPPAASSEMPVDSSPLAPEDDQVRVTAAAEPPVDSSPFAGIPAEGEAVTERGYSYTVVDERGRAQEVKRQRAPSTPLRVPKWLLAALIIVPGLIAGAAAWSAAMALDDDGGGGDRASADVASVISAFSQGQDVDSTQRFEGELPPAFPDDVPAYPGARVVSSLLQLTGDTAGYLVVYDTPDGRDDVVAHFSEAFDEDPWQVDLGQDSRDSTLRQFSKIDDADVQGIVLMAESKESDVTTIFLSVEIVSGADDVDEELFVPRVSRPLPEGFPEEVPQYGDPDAIVIETFFSKQPQGDIFGASTITRDEEAAALDFYREQFEDMDWTVTDAEPPGGEGAALTAEDAEGTLSVNVSVGEFADDENYTRVDVQVQATE